MNESEWTEVSGIMMTTEPISAYGWVQFPVELLREFASRADSANLPFLVEHDPTRPLRVRDIRMRVDERDDGIHLLKFTGEIHKDDEVHLPAHQGISVSVASPIHTTSLGAAAIIVSADAGWFDDKAIVASASVISSRNPSAGGYLAQHIYQFSEVPDPQVIIDIAYAVLINIGSSAFWDGIKLLIDLRRTPFGGSSGTPNVITLAVHHGDDSVTATVKTADPDVARRALESFDGAIGQMFERDTESSDRGGSRSVIWDDAAQHWTPPS